MTNSEFKVQLERRTVAFSVAVIKSLRNIPAGLESKNIREQVMRSATAIGANYREANRAESASDFVHKIAIVAKESAETEYWLLLLNELYPGVEGIAGVLSEAGELTRIFDKVRRTIAAK
ncbi:MAG: four helix bundle protein [bacterium]|nr:four helix bundle protein [bacterium]